MNDILIKKQGRFIAINKWAIVSLFFVILAGGVVRSTGSGMGCPDWPKCFGRYIPPHDVSQLPGDYKEKYVSGRIKKNERFAKLLDALGFKQKAYQLRVDKSIFRAEVFNTSKTWTEYINRLIGATSGIFLLLCAVFSRSYLGIRKRIFYLSLLNLFVVIVQAWLGSIVVATNLVPWIITVHMLLALLIVAISIYTYFQASALFNQKNLPTGSNGRIKKLMFFVLLLSVIQIVIGTGVREDVDKIANAYNGLNRHLWIKALGVQFEIHRFLALLVLLMTISLFVMIKNNYPKGSRQNQFNYIMIGLLLIQFLSGLVLGYFSIPAYVQTIHLMLASLAFGTQFYLFLLLGRHPDLRMIKP